MSATAPLRRPPVRPTLDPPEAAPATAPRPRPSAAPRPRAATAPRPRLVVVASRPSSAARLPFLILVGTIMVSGLVGVLLLHMIAAQDSFRATHLQQRLATLTDAEQRLDSQVEADSAPAALELRAKALGMVPARIAKFHKLHDGRTVGQQAPVLPPPTPVVTPSPQPTHKHPAANPAGGKHAANTKTVGKHAASKPGATKHTATPGTTSTQHAAGGNHSATHAAKPRTTPHHHATQG